jgi:ArsR family transcriptional regulator
VAQRRTSELIGHDDDIERAALALKSMSHPIRLKILCAIGNAELSVQDIVSRVGTTQSNVSQHLAKLREKEVLETRRDANKVFYRVKDQGVLQIIEKLRDVFCQSE